jgi:hypothetical protein
MRGISPSSAQTVSMLSAKTATGAGTPTQGISGMKTFHATGTTSAGTGSATINIEGSMSGTSWDVIGTITLTLGTSATSGGFTSNDRYAIVRGNVTAISGTGASVNLTMGY